MAARLGKRERAKRRELLAERRAILSANLNAPQPEPLKAAVRTKTGSLTVIRDRSGSTSSVERLGSCYGRFSDPRGNALKARTVNGKVVGGKVVRNGGPSKPQRFHCVDPTGVVWGRFDRKAEATAYLALFEAKTKRKLTLVDNAPRDKEPEPISQGALKWATNPNERTHEEQIELDLLRAIYRLMLR